MSGLGSIFTVSFLDDMQLYVWIHCNYWHLFSCATVVELCVFQNLICDKIDNLYDFVWKNDEAQNMLAILIIFSVVSTERTFCLFKCIFTEGRFHVYPMV